MAFTYFFHWLTFYISFVITIQSVLSFSEPEKHLVVKTYTAEQQRTHKLAYIPNSQRTNFTVWSYWSKCTRTCGGGISTRKRKCIGTNCTGPTQEFLVCNDQPCPQRDGDYRSSQCSRRNGHSIAGKVASNWIPLPGYNECQLKCKSVDLVDTYVFGKVEDGTNCGNTSGRVCLNGRCVPVGCDFIIGSKRKFDRCGVCGGHNSTCHLIRGSFKPKTISWNSDENYQEIARLPEGAYDIHVTDNTSNHLALRDSEGNFVFNGNKTIGWAGTYDLSGIVVNYSRIGHEESIFIKGPILENLVVAAFIVDRTPAIKYQYLIPKYNHRKLRVKVNGGGRSYPVYRSTPGEKQVNPKKTPRPRPEIRNELDSYLPKGPNENEIPKKSTIDRNEIIRPTTPMSPSPNSYEKPYRQTPPPFNKTHPAINIETGYNTTRWRNKGERRVGNETVAEANWRKNKKKGRCPPCDRIKNRLINFCRSDFVIRGKILNNRWFPDKRSEMKEMQYDVNVIETYKASKTLTLFAREYIYIPSPDPCACPRLRKGVEYIIMGQVDKQFRTTEYRLVLDSNSFVRKFSQKRHLEILKTKSQQDERCKKYDLPTRRDFKEA